MSFLANALVIGKIVSIASNIINKEWRSSPLGRTAQKCPVCVGEGSWIEGANTADTLRKVCHGCDGKGWVAV